MVEIEKYLTAPQMVAKFTGAVDRAAMPYIQSVLIAVEANEGLQKCTPESIGIAALRAAALQLSCDPAVRQAYMVPYKRNKKKADGSWYSYYEAVFQPHYMGLYTLAMRTNKYRTIDVKPTPAGYKLVTDLEHNTDVLINDKGQPVAYMPEVKPEEAGGWYGWFVTRTGFIKKVYWTVEQIHAHAKKYNPKGYAADKSPWQDPNFRPIQEKKTVLRDLLRWADMSGIGDAIISEALKADDDVIDAEAEAEPTAETLPSNVDQPVDTAFPNGSARLMELREKSKTDPTTAYYSACKAAGLENEAQQSILKEIHATIGEVGSGYEDKTFTAAFEKVAKAYVEVI
jgi:phage RecT family recombinase